MKHPGVYAGLVVVLLLSASTALAQRKAVKKPAAKKPVPAKTTTVLPPLEVRAARDKTQTQLDNVNQFINVLGPIAQAIETLDASSRTRRLPQATLDTNEANKQKVIEAIRNLKAGLATLESEFRVKTDLKKYLPNIEGITDLASASEDSAIAGKFVLAKEPLRNVAQRLIDTLAVMPKSAPL